MSTAQKMLIGQNIVAEVKGNILYIEVDLSKEQGLSGSGKNMVIASSGGNQGIMGTEGVKIGLNIYKPKK